MAVSVDTVYQKVLALCNKEQRGYVTPQEFNLLADRAQKEIFESYFRTPEGKLIDHKNIDNLDTINEKLLSFQYQITLGATGSGIDLTDQDFWKIDQLYDALTNNVITPVNIEEWNYNAQHPLTQATKERRIYRRVTPDQIFITPMTDLSLVVVVGWRIFKNPKWGYVVVNGEALYNVNTSDDFLLHYSDEEKVVSRILEMAGIIVQKPGLVELAAKDKMIVKQEENN
jgi:RNAse (barnase) inhibitor barstar